MAGLKHVRIIVAAVVFFALGSAWYSGLSNAWLAGIGKTAAQLQAEQSGSPLPFVIGFVAILAMCYTLGWVLMRCAVAGWKGGAQIGAIAALGLIGGMLALNYGFESRSPALWAINAGYALLGLVIAGVIIGSGSRQT